MTTIATAPGTNRPLSGLVDVLRSEWCKLGTVRSTFWTFAFAVLSNVVLAALAAIVLPSHPSSHEKATLDSVRVSLAGLHLSQIAFGLLGVLVITSEYDSGMIRASLAAGAAASSATCGQDARVRRDRAARRDPSRAWPPTSPFRGSCPMTAPAPA